MTGHSMALSTLTARQVEILRLVAEGLSSPQIARHLRLSEHTVRSHMNAIYERLEVNDRAHAVAVAFRARVLT